MRWNTSPAGSVTSSGFGSGESCSEDRGTGRRSLARRLSDALHPFHRVAHEDSASTSREVLGELARRVDLPALPHAAALLDAVDLVRGQVIPFEGDESIAALLDELGSDDAATRFRAAAVVRSVSQVIPERMVDPLCDAIGREDDPRVLGRLLLATYRVLELDHEKLLAAVRTSRAVTWDAPYPAGSALALLGHAAPLDPRAVFGLLPRRLDGLPPWARACLADVLSFAWWRLAEVEPGARPTLESLAIPDLAGVPRSFRVFAHRGASIAALGTLSVGAVDAADTTVSMTRDPDGQPPYFYTNTRDFLARRARSISRHPRAGWLADTLVRVVQAGHGLLVHPRARSIERRPEDGIPERPG
jgi:hypothetical protein